MPLVVGSGHFQRRRPGTARAPSLCRLCRAAAVSGRLRFPAARGEADCRARTTAKPQTKTCLGRGDAQPERDSSARAWARPHPAKSAARAPQQHLARRLASGAATPSRSATSKLGRGLVPSNRVCFVCIATKLETRTCLQRAVPKPNLAVTVHARDQTCTVCARKLQGAWQVRRAKTCLTTYLSGFHRGSRSRGNRTHGACLVQSRVQRTAHAALFSEAEEEVSKRPL